jgi:H+/gluconate symporter-like permease
MGLSPEIIHRAIAISCSALCMVPHSGFLIVYNSVAGFSLKDTFKDAFIAINVTGWIAMIIVVIMAGLGLA